AKTPLQPGLLANLIAKIAVLQQLELQKKQTDPHYRQIIKTAIVTARNAPAHERLINTLKDWGVDVNEAFFLGGIDKGRILDIMHPHIFFDDQLRHLTHLKSIPAVHIPFGIINGPPPAP
ncbi:MAG: 5'-nucleotidase, partial [Bacteroidales bacterium]|nr:5'-nucleotidase [Bacteroidales bacterium]